MGINSTNTRTLSGKILGDFGGMAEKKTRKYEVIEVRD